MKIKYAEFKSAGEKLQLKETELPELNEGEILVKITYTTLCRSDLHTYIGLRKEKAPTILGHEIVGQILDFGPGAPRIDLRGKELTIGDRITWAIFAGNPEDPVSKKGIPQKAKNIFKYGHEQITADSNLHGGLSEFIILRKFTPVICLKQSVPDSVAALINCSVATIAGAMRLAGDLKNKNVLVSGTGMLGIIACAMASKAGAAFVSALDIDSNRLEISKMFGADEIGHTVNDFSGKFDVIIESSGFPAVMMDTLKQIEIGGTAVWLGAVFSQEDLHINAEFIVRNLVNIKGLHNYNDADLVYAVDFIEQHQHSFDFELLICSGFNLEQVNEAFEYAVNQNPFRVGIQIT
ncbi:MAG: alcohol dehydrogenase catalytic domain-containing protein [Pedobacter sp.]|jgi:putative phosphonate catabolism associated alcohol dehydrogenase